MQKIYIRNNGPVKNFEMEVKKFNLLIGEQATGKSTIAKEIAKRLGFIYVDTGALYRTIALSAVRCGAVSDNEKIIDMLNDITVKLGFADDGSQCVYLNGEDVSSLIRTPEISMAASSASWLPTVKNADSPVSSKCSTTP